MKQAASGVMLKQLKYSQTIVIVQKGWPLLESESTNNLLQKGVQNVAILR